MNRARNSTEQQAAAWVLRRDCGLTAAEQDEFSQWLADDARHGACFARHQQNWDRLDALAQWRPEHGPQPNRDLLAPPRWSRGRVVRFASLALAAAAALALSAVIWQRNSSVPAVRASLPSSDRALLATIEHRTLDDGSVIELNRGAEVVVLYTPAARRVRLERGEAHFTVAKNPDRPFVVTAAGVDVRAVGTAFNVRLNLTAVEVLVTEGHVAVATPEIGGQGTEASGQRLEVGTAKQSSGFRLPVAELIAGQRTVISLQPAAPAPQIETVSAAQIERLLAWQPRWLDFTATPLSAIVAEFNRRNPVRLVIADAAVGATPISALLRSDNVDGFARLLEAGFGVRAERAGSTITLRKAP
jgi:transmembrane sensor